MNQRLRYWLAGFAFGMILFLSKAAFIGRWNSIWLILGPILLGNASLGLAQWMGWVKPPEAPSPITLFPRDSH